MLATNKIIKVISLLLGYSLWFFLGQSLYTTQWLKVPIYFYNVPEEAIIESQPETIHIQVYGKLSDIRSITPNGLHIDAQSFKKGTYAIGCAQEQLFLPESINVIQYNPTKILAVVTSK